MPLGRRTAHELFEKLHNLSNMPHGTRTAHELYENFHDVSKMPYGATAARDSLAELLVEPTGAKALTFVASSLGAGAGTTHHVTKRTYHVTKRTYHGTKRIVKKIIKVSEKEDKQRGEISEEEDGQGEEVSEEEDEQEESTRTKTTEYESCIRKLSSAMTGVVVKGSMTFVLPYLLVGTAVNTVEVAYQLGKLLRLIEEDPDWRENISGLNISVQILSGVLLTLLVTVLTVGQGDVELLLNGINSLISEFSPNSHTGHTEEVKKLHCDLLQHSVVEKTTNWASAPTDNYIESLGHKDDWEPTWDIASIKEVMQIGLIAALTDSAVAKVLEDPVHKLADALSPKLHDFRDAFRAGRKAMEERFSPRVDKDPLPKIKTQAREAMA